MSEVEEHKDAAAEESDLPERIMDAVRRAVRAAVREHKLLGNPIAGVRDGKMVMIPPEDIKV